MTADQPEKQPRNKAAHLEPHQFTKGESGNPTGRPKGTVSIVGALRRHLRENPSAEADCAVALIELFKEGNAQAIKQIMDRIDGPVPTKIEVSQLDDATLLRLLAGTAPDGSVSPGLDTDDE